VLIGDGNDRPRLEQLARNLHVAEHASFLHRVTSDQLSACYTKCDVFALPSRGEGFGMVFLEAIAHGKPVIGGAHGGIPDIVRDGVTGLLVPHGNIERLTQALESILTNPIRAGEMGARGRNLLAEAFSFAQFQSRISEILNSVLSLAPETERSANS
jgi:glycosyltransferase involved in cell wall biosynthesis